MNKHKHPVDKYPKSPDQDALAFANGDSAWKEMVDNWKELPRRTKMGLVFGTIAVLGVLGKVGHDERQDLQRVMAGLEEIEQKLEGTEQSLSEIIDPLGFEAGEQVGRNFIKPDEIDSALEITPQDVSENPVIPGNDGQKVLQPQPPAGESEPEAESQIGDAIAAVRGENGELIYVDPVTGEPLPPSEQPEG